MADDYFIKELERERNQFMEEFSKAYREARNENYELDVHKFYENNPKFMFKNANEIIALYYIDVNVV